MPITVTIEYPIEGYYTPPQSYGSRDKTVVDAILKDKYRIKRTIVMDDDCEKSIEDSTAITNYWELPYENGSVREVIHKACDRERAREWTILPKSQE